MKTQIEFNEYGNQSTSSEFVRVRGMRPFRSFKLWLPTIAGQVGFPQWKPPRFNELYEAIVRLARKLSHEGIEYSFHLLGIFEAHLRIRLRVHFAQ